jgi:predicted RNase H-like nuclease (RuvC/YqgF family)
MDVEALTISAGMTPGSTANVRFFYEKKRLGAKSDEEGRDVGELEEYIAISFPGSRDEFVGVVEERHKKEYAAQYNNWKKNNQEKTVIGTLLTDWPQITRSLAENFNHMGVYTVEQLAAASDAAIDRLGPDSRRLHNSAKDWLELAKEKAPALRLKKEIAIKDQQIERLQTQLDELNAKFEQFSGKKSQTGGLTK